MHIRQPTFGGAMDVLNGNTRLNFPFFYALPPPLGPHNPPGRAGWSPFWAEGRALRAAIVGISALSALPFGRFSASGLLGTLIHVPFGRFGA